MLLSHLCPNHSLEDQAKTSPREGNSCNSFAARINHRMPFVHGVLTHEALRVLCSLVLPSTCCQLRSMLLLLGHSAGIRISSIARHSQFKRCGYQSSMQHSCNLMPNRPMDPRHANNETAHQHGVQAATLPSLPMVQPLQPQSRGGES